MKLRFGEKTIKQGTEVVNKFSAEVIAGKRRLATEGATLGPDLLSRFLDTSEDNGEVMSDKELRDVVMNFMIAGRDTTACALSWTLYEIAGRPDIQDKIRAELLEVCGDDTTAPNFEQIGEMRYMHAVTMEVLRLHPSVPKDVKFAIKDDVLPDGTKVSGWGVCTNLHPPSPIHHRSTSIHRPPSTIDQPPSTVPRCLLVPAASTALTPWAVTLTSGTIR
mmetsp:Transcript_48017/g.134108  ORF Transcript_48017/g.134108 Transcript_48017/m.134108 type:complete len:220 (-) Transcript_48017:106-765(-)